jgi:hypothetical protein
MTKFSSWIFLQVSSYEEIPSWFLAQAQDKMGYVQETVNFLTEYLITTPLDWLVGIQSKTQLSHITFWWLSD